MLKMRLISSVISHGVILVEKTRNFFTGVFKIQKIKIPIGILIYVGSTLQLVENMKPIPQLLYTCSSWSDLGIYMIYNIYKFQEK